MEVQPYRWEAPKSFDDVLQRIKAASTNQEKLRAIFDTLIQYQPLLTYRVGRGNIFWRGRRANSEAGFPQVEQLGPPPSAITEAGRLNDPGRPVLYASTRTHTVFTELQEVHLEEGDYVHLIGIRIKPKIRFHIMAIGELFHIFKTGRSRVLGDQIAGHLNRMLNDTDPNFARRLVSVDALLDFYLGDPNARDNEYLHSRAIATAIFRKLELIEAFFYPSVRQESGMNLAIKAETYKEKVHVVCSQVVQILRCRELGLYDYEICSHAKRINDDGTFEWLNGEEEASNYAVLFGMSKEEEKFCQTRNNTLTGNDYLDIVKLPSAPDT